MLTAVRDFPSDVYPKQLLLETNRALFETGRMGWEDFSYRQEPDGLLPTDMAAVAYIGALDTFFRLGLVNLAEQYAHEAIVLAGNRPQLLRLLALTNIVKGEAPRRRCSCRR